MLIFLLKFLIYRSNYTVDKNGKEKKGSEVRREDKKEDEKKKDNLHYSPPLNKKPLKWTPMSRQKLSSFRGISLNLIILLSNFITIL